jgi:PAS domain S-box-containing protein
MSRALEIENEEDAGTLLTDSNNCIVIISGEKGNRGEILEANHKMAEVFESSAEDIIGKSINMFMARPFEVVHNAYLTQYIEDKRVDVSKTARKGIIMKNMSGYVFEGDVQVREYANFTLEPSIAFFGVIKPLPSAVFCLVKRSDLTILEVSKFFFQFFSPDSGKLRALQVKLTEHIVNFKQMKLQIDAHLEKCTDAFRFEGDLTNGGGQKIEGAVLVSGLRFLESDYYHVVLEVAQEDGRSQVSGGEAKKVSRRGLLLQLEASHITEQVEEEEEETEQERKARKLGELNRSLGISDPESLNSSVTSSTRNGNILRMTLTRTNSFLDSSLRYLLYSIVVLLGLLCGLGVCVQVLWGEMTIGRHMATLNLLTSPVQVGAVTATYSALLLQHIINGTLLTTEESRMIEEQRIRKDLTKYRDELDAFRNHFFTELSYLSPQEVAKIRNATVNVVSHEDKATRMSLMEAVHQYTVSMSLILKRNLTELHREGKLLDLLIANRDTQLPQVWDSVCQAILQQQVDSSVRVLVFEYACMLGALGLVGIVTLTVFYPTVYRVDTQRADIYALFEKISLLDMRTMYQQCLHALSEMDAPDSGAMNMDLQDLMEGIGSKKNRTEGVHKNKIRVSLASVLLHRMSLGAAFLLAITAAYFLGYYMWWLREHTNQFSGIEYRVYHGIQRKYLIRQVLLDMTHYDVAMGRVDMDPASITQWEDLLWGLDHALYYGDARFHIPTDIRQMDGGSDLLNRDLCSMFSPETHTNLNLTRCTTFLGGVLTQNTHEAVIAFVSLSQHIRTLFVQDSNSTEILPLVNTLKELADVWLPAAQDVYNSWIRRIFVRGHQDAAYSRHVGTVAYILVCALAFFLYYLPMVQDMNRNLIQTRSLLLIIPTDIIESSKALKDTLKTIAMRMLQNE